MNRSADWMSQAARDLEKARLDAQYEYWEWACFTSQQAAEKAVKGLLLNFGKVVWGHAITPMLCDFAEAEIPSYLIVAAQLLDAYYIPAHDPNGFSSGKLADYFNREKAEQAIQAAHAIIQFCQNLLAGS
ncbi:MAG: HEPN domain-containing protein [Bellilinea sp.]|nr:HEPN domain-containing protein [Bellilinea sp.]